MPDRLNSVTIDPSSIKSGESITVTVEYEADAAGQLGISCPAAFSISRTSVPLPAADDGTKEFTLKVKRSSGPPPRDCRLTFTFVNSKTKLVEVT